MWISQLGVRLRHPKFLECTRVGLVVGSSPGQAASGDVPPRRPPCCDAVAAGRRTSGI